MDVNLFGLVTGVVVTILASIFTFFNKQRYEAQVALYRDGNDELRKQLKDVKDERDESQKEVTEYRARYEEQGKSMTILEKLNSRQADFGTLSKQLASYHDKQMEAFTNLATKIVDKT